MLVRVTQIDYDREMAFIAVDHSQGQQVQVGVARYTTEPDGESAEFAVVVSDAWQDRDGRLLLDATIDSACESGPHDLFGEALRHNRTMLAPAER